MSKSIKTRWHSIILYPDNAYHVRIMEYLDSDKNPYQGVYIKHEPNCDENKEHWHVVLYFPNPRSSKGVADSFGHGNFIILADGRKEPCLDVTGYDSERISVEPLVGDSLCSTISDIHSYAMYLLHKNFECMMKGKKEYDISDIKPFNNDFNIIPKMFELDKVQESGSELYEIIQFIKDFDCRNMTHLISDLYINREYHLLKYVESHAYLIKNLL